MRMGASPKEVQLQRAYYAQTAEQYDGMHSHEAEHHFALSFLQAAIGFLGAESVLDVGAGTGRTITFLKEQCPSVSVSGVEPSAPLREIGYSKGLSTSELFDGDATRLSLPDASFDIVCEFAVLHHIRDSRAAVSEMLRVARRAVFISDCNNFGQGGVLARSIKQALNAAGLWGVANMIKTRGRGYMSTEGDGISYSYSVFNDYPLLQQHCRSIHVVNSSGAHVSHYRSAPNVAVLAIK
jgi:ubiquinone/menaquinone biosynthesis C-methylase UbiE